MSILQILHFPDDRLRKIASPVKKMDDQIRQIADDMLETMYQAEGIGLAATQVNIHQRIIVIDVSEDRHQPLILINPELLEKSGETGIEEGCLSIPGEKAFIPRAKEITIQALNREGRSFRLSADDLLAICIQHEMDHLIGKLFVDYLSPFKRQRIQKKMEKLQKINEKKDK
ncbi:peptide deformylase [Candidatus Hamiltonella defensa]|uniref:Peptide deformylase n=2 Tax=Candidatus Williamhamiltonella defendens TaxID=138072 RepID=DEF_HAMD5|nr:peptide deformylase [Candidatus Hamiltonella defensa]C4K6Y0.1 RecName: Full=Peptide deformylase; Short=PDF; AltName: Full=Polypeptide deformylase [Candidatus Hamiltonella defensa 5AT (Acyrthosiphon pisum)]ACQ68323.1 peptide deformylase [Candidatus Hamiltonella defensa 5AT (Acyrthosiphon pisum)]ASV33024.1 peptide deformylase [Candidatus Hamiltonella defensa]ATW22887.1 peptide deformylase [Candidatus Hamiltonella defensa]AWK15977.1 peptide deformylase [Candidatus Hamiltonella defensa]MBK4361